MAIRTKYSSLDMVRMGRFAKDNPNLKPMPLIKAYCKKYPEVTEEQKLKNIRNWLDDKDIMRLTRSFCLCKKPKYNYPEMIWCDNCGLEID